MISKNVDSVTQSSRGEKATSFDITTITVVGLCEGTPCAQQATIIFLYLGF